MVTPGPGALVPAGSIAYGAPSPGIASTNSLLVPTGAPSPDPEYAWTRLSDAGNATL